MLVFWGVNQLIQLRPCCETMQHLILMEPSWWISIMKHHNQKLTEHTGQALPHISMPFVQRKWSNSILTHWKFNMDILRHILTEPFSTTTPFIPSTGGISLSKAPNFPSKKPIVGRGRWRPFPMRKPTLESYLEFPKKNVKITSVFWSFQTCKTASMVAFTSFHMFDVLETSLVLEPPLKTVFFGNSLGIP